MAKTLTPSPTTSHSDTTSRATGQLASELRFAVMRLARRLRQHSLEGTTPSQMSALATLARTGPLTVSQLAESEKVQPPTITRVVDSLSARGLVTRTPSEDDRRVAWVDATTEGRQLVEAIRRRRDAYLASRLRTLTAEDRRVLARAAELLEQLTEDPA
jgi:DNA-binding MarR family transcriptional regulator